MYYRRGGLFSSLPKITKDLLIINIIAFIITSFKGDAMYEQFALFHPSSPFFHFWQPITYMFMHGGFWHIFFNMYTLLIFGSTLERVWGPKKFLLFYMVTGIGAAAIHVGVQSLEIAHFNNLIADGVSTALQSKIDVLRTPTVGASGAIYGLLLGYCMLYPDSTLQFIFPPIAVKAWVAVAIFAGIELISGVLGGGGVAHFAHLGGMLFGLILILYWKKRHVLYEYYE